MFNQTILFGRLTANPEYRETANNSTMCSFSVAVDRPKTKDGNQTADFINCTAWGKTADVISHYFSKGKPIMVIGRLQNNNYTDRNGIKRYTYVVLVQSVSFTLNDSTQNHGVGDALGDNQVNYTANYQPTQNEAYNNYIGNPRNQMPPLPSENIGDLSDFEVISDGEIPF